MMKPLAWLVQEEMGNVIKLGGQEWQLGDSSSCSGKLGEPRVRSGGAAVLTEQEVEQKNLRPPYEYRVWLGN